MAFKIASGEFIAGGLAQGIGQGIEKMADQERQYALMQYQANREFGLKQMELEEHHSDALLGAQSRVDAAKEAAKGQIGRGEAQGAATVKAAGINAGASEANNIRTTDVQRARNEVLNAADALKGKVLTRDTDGNMLIADLGGANGTPVFYKGTTTPVKADNTIKLDPNKPMSESVAVAVATLQTDPDVQARAKKNKLTPAQQAMNESVPLVQQARTTVGADKPKVPGLVAAPADSDDSAASAAAAPAPAAPPAPPPLVTPPAAQQPAVPSLPTPPPAGSTMSKPIPLPQDRSQIVVDGKTVYQTSRGAALAQKDPQGNIAFIPAPVGQ